MWTKKFTAVYEGITPEQFWSVYSDVNHWHLWDEGIEYACLNGKFEQGNQFILKPKGGAKVKIDLERVIENKQYIDITHFPLSKMYGDHQFEATENGTKVTIVITIKGLLNRVWAQLVGKDIIKNLPDNIEKQIEIIKSHGK